MLGNRYLSNGPVTLKPSGVPIIWNGLYFSTFLLNNYNYLHSCSFRMSDFLLLLFAQREKTWVREAQFSGEIIVESVSAFVPVK